MKILPKRIELLLSLCDGLVIEALFRTSDCRSLFFLQSQLIVFQALTFESDDAFGLTYHFRGYAGDICSKEDLPFGTHFVGPILLAFSELLRVLCVFYF